jgi:hypothetical protein
MLSSGTAGPPRKEGALLVRKTIALAMAGAVTLGVAGPVCAQGDTTSDMTQTWLNSLDTGGWVTTSISADERTATFRRPPEHKPDGAVVMWERFERRDEARGEWRSLVSLSEFDCLEGRARTLQETTYSQPNLTGRSSTASMPGTWTYPIPGSMMETSMRLACHVDAAANRAQAAPAAAAARAKGTLAAPAATPATKKKKSTTAKATSATGTAAKETAAKTTSAKAPAAKASAKPHKKKPAPPPEPAEKHIDIPLTPPT